MLSGMGSTVVDAVEMILLDRLGRNRPLSFADRGVARDKLGPIMAGRQVAAGSTVLLMCHRLSTWYLYSTIGA